MYAAHTPGKQLYSARGAKLSPVHDRLVANGGYLREVSGWEGADWFAGPGRTPEATPTWGRRRLVRAVGGRAPRHPRAGRADGHVVHVEVPRHRRRRRARARPRLGGRGRRRGRADHLHPVARRRRQAAGRPDRHQARRRRLLGGRLRHRPRPRAGMAAPAHRRRATSTVDGRHRGLAPSSTSRARARATCSPTLTDADLSNDAFPFRTARFVTLARCPVAAGAHHVRRGARLRALPPGRRRAHRVRRRGRGRRASRSGSRRWPAAGWRRAIATSATTSTTPTT